MIAWFPRRDRDRLGADRRRPLGRLGRLLDEVDLTGPVSARTPTMWDWLLALVAAGAAAFEALTEDQLPLVRLAAGIAVALVVPHRRQRPLTGVLVALALHLGVELAARRVGQDGEDTIGFILASIVLLYALSRWAPPGRVLIGVGLVVVTLVVSELVVEDPVGEDDLSFLVPWLILPLVALAMRYRWVMLDQRDRRVRIAERHALARDVHDSVAHHVSAISVQAQAARYVAGSDQAAAIEAMARVETEAGQAVDELRRLVGILRADDPAEAVAVPAALAELADPVGRPPVVVAVGGDEPGPATDLTDLTPSVATGVYRIAQEAITNARRHSRHATEVRVTLLAHDDRVELEISDDGVSAAPGANGYGLVGMRERAAVLGGAVTFGPTPEGGWRVRAVLPTS